MDGIRQSLDDSYSYTLLKASAVMVYTLADVQRKQSDVKYYPGSLPILSNFGPLIRPGAIIFRITPCEQFTNHTPKTFSNLIPH